VIGRRPANPPDEFLYPAEFTADMADDDNGSRVVAVNTRAFTPKCIRLQTAAMRRWVSPRQSR
jgi:hypothetical protein